MSIYSYYRNLRMHTLKAEEHLRNGYDALYQQDKAFIFNDLANITNHSGTLTLTEKWNLSLIGMSMDERMKFLMSGGMPAANIAEKVENAAYKTMKRLNEKLKGQTPPEPQINPAVRAAMKSLPIQTIVNHIAWG